MLVVGLVSVPADMAPKAARKCLTTGCRMLRRVLDVLDALQLGEEEVGEGEGIGENERKEERGK